MGATPASPPGNPSTLSWIDTVDKVRNNFRTAISLPAAVVVEAARERAGKMYPSLGNAMPLALVGRPSNMGTNGCCVVDAGGELYVDVDGWRCG